MSAPKILTLSGLLGAVEASYGAGASLAAADHGILMDGRPDLVPQYAHEGTRELAVGTGGRLQNAPPSGRWGTFEAPIVALGAGEAYAAAVTPPHLHTLLRISGHSATLDDTEDEESWTYAPTTVDPASGAFEAYSRVLTYETPTLAEKVALTHAYAIMGFELSEDSFMRFNFEIQGVIGADIEDVTFPTIAYATHIPPVARDINFTLGADNGSTPFTGGVVRSLSFSQGRALDPRLDRNAATGHAGFTPGRRGPELEVSMEAVELATASPWHTASTLNPYKLHSEGVTFPLSFQVGSAQYNRIKFSAAQAQIINVEGDEDGESALWNLTILLPTSGLAANDDYEIFFD